MNLRERIEQAGDLPPGLAAVLGILVIALLVGVVWALLWLPDHTKLRSPAARERARRRKESRKRQSKLRARREALQRKAGRR
ncbi:MULTISPECIES: hypothetical protein [unclassified Streptomyces]|uniref:hypothetical protein n=1 Tax=unclassified Streptomyces TaxID=2593676 RepID=UPI000F6BC9F7|nr:MULTISPECIES: hypothetical protein [unclassified Streptomyces]AZM58269.1 hypothetical protein DLM49_00745 [Streptomyces sp. WAC 01438]RSM88778.1 hypothetical protein DMA10_31450 [Streptomyces sp. WAC 01420]